MCVNSYTIVTPYPKGYGFFMIKVNAYIDGFNLYHALKNLQNQKLKWLDLHKLLSSYLSEEEEIQDIYYFSAFAHHIDKATVQRHQVYVDALKTKGIHFISGNFKNKVSGINKSIRQTYSIPASVKNCGHEEKESDVNLALYILRDAIKHSCDKMFIVTNDTDIAPAIRMAKKENPVLTAFVLTPPSFSQIHHALKNATGQPYTFSITRKKVEDSLFPDEIIKSNGKKIHKPFSWN